MTPVLFRECRRGDRSMREDMYRSSLCFVAIFSAIIAVASGCNCAPPRFNRLQSYCKAEFTIRGRVVQYQGLDVPHSSENRHKKYRVAVSRAYRILAPVKRSIKIYTPSNPEFCGVNLTVGITYIFNGKYTHDQYIINSCEWNEKWRYVPRWYRALLRVLYRFC